MIPVPFSRLPALVGACLALAVATPARAQISILGQTVQEQTMLAGQLVSGTVIVSNAGRTPQAVRLYMSDYWFDAAGNTRYDPPGSQPRSNADWIRLDASQVTVPAGGTAAVRYTMRAPAGAPAGTHWSLMLVEPASTAAPSAPGQSISVGTSVRYGIQLVSHLTGGAPNVEVSTPRAHADETGAFVLEFDLVNAGTVGVRPEISVELLDAAGRSVATLRQQRGLIYPGTGLRQHFERAGLARGTYTAVIVADAGGDAVFGAQSTVSW